MAQHRPQHDKQIITYDTDYNMIMMRMKYNGNHVRIMMITIITNSSLLLLLVVLVVEVGVKSAKMGHFLVND